MCCYSGVPSICRPRDGSVHLLSNPFLEYELQCIVPFHSTPRAKGPRRHRGKGKLQLCSRKLEVASDTLTVVGKVVDDHSFRATKVATTSFEGKGFRRKATIFFPCIPPVLTVLNSVDLWMRLQFVRIGTVHAYDNLSLCCLANRVINWEHLLGSETTKHNKNKQKTPQKDCYTI